MQLNWAGFLPVILAAAIGVTAVPATDPPDIVFPLPPTPVVPPNPPPNPAPNVGDVPVLKAGVLYTVEWNKPLTVIQRPKGLLVVREFKLDYTDVKGTQVLRTYAKFLYGPDLYQERTWTVTEKDKTRYVYQAHGIKSGPVELMFLPGGQAVTEADIVTKNLVVDMEDGIKPKPDDPPVPVPSDDPPIPGTGLRLLIVYETGTVARLPIAQQSVLFTRKIRDYLNTKAAVNEADNSREWRIYDKDTDVSQDRPWVKDAMARQEKGVGTNAKGKRTTLPWLMVAKDGKGYEGPLLENVDKNLELIKRFGGE